MRHATVIFKPTGLCNAGCIYCSAYDDNREEKKMTREILDRLFDRIEEWKISTPELREVKFLWHGGEPTLMPDSFFYRAIERQEELRENHNLGIKNIIQSNLLNLNDRKVKMLKALLTDPSGEVGRIGTSYDPTPGIRITDRGDYNQQWRESLNLLRKNGLPFGILFVVHRIALERMDEILDMLLEEFPDVGFRFNPLYKEGRASREDKCLHLYITSRQWGEFLVHLYRRWESLSKKPRWAPLQEIDQFHQAGQFRLGCNYSGRCATHYLGIDTDGRVYSCGRGIDRRHECYGDIRTDSFKEMLSHPARIRMLNRTPFLRNTKCRDCPWWRYCHGGCPMDAAINFDDIFQKTNLCEARKFFFTAVYGTPAQIESHPDETS